MRIARKAQLSLAVTALGVSLVAGLPGTAVAATFIPASTGSYLNQWCGDNPPMTVNTDGSVFHPGSGCGQRFTGLAPLALVEAVVYHTGGIAAPTKICGHFVATDELTGSSTRTATHCTEHYVIVTAPFQPPLVRTGSYTIVWNTDSPSPSWADAHVYGHIGT